MFITKVNQIQLSKLQNVARFLETYKGGRYFVYTSDSLTLQHIRTKAKDPRARPTWGARQWTSRFKEYAVGELRFIEALENYQDLNVRTFNISEADFILVPIPLSATLFWGDKSDVENAFNYLFKNESMFQAHPEKHLYFSIIEKLLRSDTIKIFHNCCGFSYEIVTKISVGILVKDFDPQEFKQYLTSHVDEYWTGTHQTTPVFRYYWSLGWSHEASDSSYNLTVASYDDWKNKKHIFFYRTIPGTSMYNSTQYRHALFRKNMTEFDKVVQPSAIGFQVPYGQWLDEISSSKYCLVIRGDSPGSRSLFTAIRFGCLPVIVSNALPYFQPLFRSLLNFDDFSIMIEERDFLSNPADSINRAIQFLSESDKRRLISGLELIQRMLILDHPRSLFVPAFVHETIATMQHKKPFTGEYVATISMQNLTE